VGLGAARRLKSMGAGRAKSPCAVIQRQDAWSSFNGDTLTMGVRGAARAPMNGDETANVHWRGEAHVEKPPQAGDHGARSGPFAKDACCITATSATAQATARPGLTASPLALVIHDSQAFVFDRYRASRTSRGVSTLETVGIPRFPKHSSSCGSLLRTLLFPG